MIRVLIVPKFEVGEMSGDALGEAQLFYENYCAGCDQIEVPHMPSTARFFYNEENGVAILITGAGKNAASLSLTALFSSGLYDCSDTYIVSVGCGGGNMDAYTLGDVIINTAVCDYDLGYHADSSEFAPGRDSVTWFYDKSYGRNAYSQYSPKLCEAVYQLTKGCELSTTQKALDTLRAHFPDCPRGAENPAVLKGTAITSDSFWKGEHGHQNALHIVEFYGCPDPYATTEMEEISIALAAESYGMLDRLVSLRVIVNADQFFGDDTPESVWGDPASDSYSVKVEEDNDETLDIFEPGMNNLYAVASTVIDAILAGEIG